MDKECLGSQDLVHRGLELGQDRFEHLVNVSRVEEALR